MKKLKFILGSYGVTLSMLAAMLFPVSDTVVALESSSSCSSGTYVISAYYSPVPGQMRYATGTYDGDIRLNGRGVRTASGVMVAEATGPFVAGPPCMSFGTKLAIAGLGEFVVLDRGGAIKGNRLDIWMGYGDEGLKAALTWGKRTVPVNVTGNTANYLAPTGGGFNAQFNALKKFQQVQTVNPFEFVRELKYGDYGEDVARLQQLLKDVFYFKGEVTGIFDNNTKLALDKFNSSKGVLKANVGGKSGNFGNSHFKLLLEEYVILREKYFDSPTRSLGRGSEGEDVRKLQTILVKLGLLSTASGVYDIATVEAVTAFQVAEGVIKSTADTGAGYFGPSTQLALDRILEKFEGKVTTAQTLEKQSTDILLDDVKIARIESYFDEDFDGTNDTEKVLELQKILQDMNLLLIDPTGEFGPLTERAVTVFQLKLGLIQSTQDKDAGRLNGATKEALNSYVTLRNQFVDEVLLAKKSAVVLSSETDKFEWKRDLKLGDTGDDVRELQTFLKDRGYFKGTIISDYFGHTTLVALQAFLKYNGLDEGDLFGAEAKKFVNSL